MRNRSVVILTVCLLATFIAGATVHAADYYTKHDKKDQHRGDPRGVPQEGHALVYVFRPALLGAAVKTWAFADDDLLMVSKSKAYSFAQVPAGKRLFWTKSDNNSALALEVEAGKTYYIKIAFKMALMKAARAKVSRIGEREAQKHFQKCSYVQPTDAGRARAAEIVADLKRLAAGRR